MGIVDIGTALQVLLIIEAGRKVPGRFTRESLVGEAVVLLALASSHHVPGARNGGDHTEDILVIDEPVVAQLHVESPVGVVLEGLGVLFEVRFPELERRGEIHTHIIYALVEIDESVRLFAAVVQIRPQVLVPFEHVRLFEIHSGRAAAQ